MQLFIIDFDKSGNRIVINNKEISHQMKKVLRMSTGDLFFAQTSTSDYKSKTTRYQAKIEEITSNTVK
jgi:16S rRNA U1498 N3-methylase RsmE